MPKTAKIENNVIKNLADITGEKKKAFDTSTVIHLFSSNKTKFDKKSNIVSLSYDDTTILITSLEKEYKIFFTGQANQALNASSLTALIASKLDEIEKLKKVKRAEKKAKKKAVQSVVPTFSFKTSGNIFEFEVIDNGSNIRIDTNTVSAGPDFWNKFNKWFSQNRKTLTKKPKKNKSEPVQADTQQAA